jgi:hypothetical protein
MIHTRGLLLALIGLLGSLPYAPTRAVEIKYRSFSGSAAMGPAAEAFAARLQALSTATLGEAGAISFVKLSPTPDIPSQFNKSIMSAVAAGSAGGGFDAAYQSAGDINATWGFLYNSGVPFGPSFDEFMGFLYGKSIDGRQTGLELLQATLDAAGANVVAIPIVGGSEQASGYFPLPVGAAPGTWGIGLVGLCQQNWTFRYLPPAQYVLDRACNNLVSRRVIKANHIKFVAAVSGNGSLVDGVKSGQIQAFEFATPYDDLSQLFTGTDNPGTVGVRYMHFPGWHQQWLLTYMLVNKPVWNGMTPAQRALFQSAARDNVILSYGENLRQQGPALRAILQANASDSNPGNDMVLVKWPDVDLALLREATIQVLDGRTTDSTLPAADRQAYATILEALRTYVRANDLYWDWRALDPQMRFRGWTSPSGQAWSEPGGPSWWSAY